MRYLFLLLLTAVALLSVPVLADDGCGSECPAFRQCDNWPDSATGASVTVCDAPPELGCVEAYRWKQAMPSAKARLAELYGISKEEAIAYGAIYPKPRPSYTW